MHIMVLFLIMVIAGILMFVVGVVKLILDKLDSKISIISTYGKVIYWWIVFFLTFFAGVPALFSFMRYFCLLSLINALIVTFAGIKVRGVLKRAKKRISRISVSIRANYIYTHGGFNI